MDEFKALVDELTKATVDTPENIANKLASQMGTGGGDKGQELVRTEFGLNNANVSAATSSTRVDVTAGVPSGSGIGSATVKITGDSDMFNKLVDALKGLKVSQTNKIGTGDNDASGIATKLGGSDVLGNDEVTNAIKELVKEIGVSGAESVSVTNSGSNVTVTISGTGGSGSPEQTGSAVVNVNSTNITIQVTGTSVDGLTQDKCKAIAIAIVLALLNEEVVKQISDGVTFALEGDKQPEVKISVTGATSNTQANRIAWKLGKALTSVKDVSVKVGSSNPPATLKLSLSLNPWFKPGNV